MSDNSASLLGKIAGYTEILAKDPQSTVFVSLCEAYRQLGMLDDALEIAQKGTRSLAGFSPGFVAMGRIYAQQGDLADAANAFERALSIEKDSLPALKGLARSRYRQGYLDKARDLLLQARQLNPQDPVVNKMLESISPGEPKARVEAGSPVSQAEAKIVEPVVTQPEVPEVEPVVAAEPVSDATPIPTATLAELYLKQGLLSEAARIYRDILRLDPDNEQARTMLVDLKQRMSEQDRVDTGSLESSEPAVELVEDEVTVEQECGVESAPSQLDVYQRWLNAIEQRRAHVC